MEARHTGHADVVRELIDGVVGMRADNPFVASSDEPWWAAYRDKLERVAQAASGD